jgi:hypothetical protein
VLEPTMGKLVREGVAEAVWEVWVRLAGMQSVCEEVRGRPEQRRAAAGDLSAGAWSIRAEAAKGFRLATL